MDVQRKLIDAQVSRVIKTFNRLRNKRVDAAQREMLAQYRGPKITYHRDSDGRVDGICVAYVGIGLRFT